MIVAEILMDEETGELVVMQEDKIVFITIKGDCFASEPDYKPRAGDVVELDIYEFGGDSDEKVRRLGASIIKRNPNAFLARNVSLVRRTHNVYYRKTA